jgi:hypothetical protein
MPRFEIVAHFAAQAAALTTYPRPTTLLAKPYLFLEKGWARAEGKAVRG